MSDARPSFVVRLRLAWAVLWGAPLPQRPALAPTPAAPSLPALNAPAPRAELSALHFLAMLQREARLVDFVQDDVTPYADADVGAAARVVHQGLRKVFQSYLSVSPVATQAEGESLELAQGFDANRFRLVGNVTGAGPYRGTVRHRGWQVTENRLPEVTGALDAKVLAPAEVELP